MRDLNERDYEALKKIRIFEETAPSEEWPLGWQWYQVGVAMGTINKLITMGMVERTYSSRSSKEHKLTVRAREIMDAEPGDDLTPPPVIGGPGEEDYANMFSDIVGYDNLKELLRESLQLEKPIHVLLSGPPAIAKTMFLWDIERVLSEQAMWLVGSATSRAGLWDAVAESRPKVLLIDELDKMTATDTAALLSLMEKGRLVRTKVHRRLDLQLDVWIIGSANRLTRMAPELLSRFKVYKIGEYSAVEFRNVVTKALVRHEGVTESAAAEIAMRLVGKTHDVRDAVRVARLSKRVGVARAVELLIEEGRTHGTPQLG